MSFDQPNFLNPKKKPDEEKNKSEEAFRHFIRKDEYYLTPTDQEALEKMRESPEDTDEDSELKFIRGNHVILGEIENPTGFYGMKNEEGEDVERYSKKQRFVSQLASGLIPAASIGVKDGKYYSKLVGDHEAFSESSEKNTALFALIQCVLFRDIDKPGSDRPNILGGVSFDFDYANFDTKDTPVYHRVLETIKENMGSVSQKDIQLMLRLIENFKTQISGEEGEKHLEKNSEVSGYKLVPAKQIQSVLLERIDELKSILHQRV